MSLREPTHEGFTFAYVLHDHRAGGSVEVYACGTCGALVGHSTKDDEPVALDLHRAWHRRVESPFGGAFGSSGLV